MYDGHFSASHRAAMNGCVWHGRVQDHGQDHQGKPQLNSCGSLRCWAADIRTGGMKSKSPCSRRISRPHHYIANLWNRILQSKLNEVDSSLVLVLRRVIMFKKIAVRVSAVAFVMLAIALAPGVPAVLATVRTTAADDDAKLNQPLAEQSCAAFESWFLDPTCRQTHAKKAARTKRLWPTT